MQHALQPACNRERTWHLPFAVDRAPRSAPTPAAARREFGAQVRMWATFNEANVMGFCGWLWGQFPPGKFARFKTAGKHLLTCLRAHGAAYIAIKRLPGARAPRSGGGGAFKGVLHKCQSQRPCRRSGHSGACGVRTGGADARAGPRAQVVGSGEGCVGAQAVALCAGAFARLAGLRGGLMGGMSGRAGGSDMRVGLVHNHMSYAVKDPRAFSVRWVQPVIDWLDRVWGTAEVVRYFRTGRFMWRTPPLCGGNVEAADAPPGIDWVGLNFYGRCGPQGRERTTHVPCCALNSSASFLVLCPAMSALHYQSSASSLARL